MGRSKRPSQQEIRQKIAKGYNDRVHELQAENNRLRNMVADRDKEIEKLKEDYKELNASYAKYKLFHGDASAVSGSMLELLNHLSDRMRF